MSFIDTFKSGLWPDGKLKPPSVPRTVDEKERTRDEANRKLSALMPGTGLRTSSWTLVDHSHCRFGRQHDWKIERAKRCAQNLRGFAEPKVEPAHCIYDHRRGGCPSYRPFRGWLKRPFRCSRRCSLRLSKVNDGTFCCLAPTLRI